MRVFTVIVCGLVMGLSPNTALADEDDDAAEIAQHMLTDEAVEATFATIGTLMGDIIVAEARRTGLDISDEASTLLGDMLLTEMIKGMGPMLRDIHSEIYTENLSAEELEMYVTFLRSGPGQAVSRLQPTLIEEGAKRGESLGQELAPDLFGAVVENLQAGRLPEGTNPKVSDELVRLLAGK